MRQFGITSNIMSLSGIAIAIGVLVDAAIVMTENVIRHARGGGEEKGVAAYRASETFDVVLAASQQVGRPIFFAMAIIILAFVPVFALTGQEGKFFHPLAFTKTFAMIGSTLLAVTIVPVLCTWLVRGPFHSEERNVVMRLLLRALRPGARLGAAATATRSSPAPRCCLLAAVVVAFGLPRRCIARSGLRRRCSGSPQAWASEFMPPLNEGSPAFHADVCARDLTER